VIIKMQPWENQYLSSMVTKGIYDKIRFDILPSQPVAYPGIFFEGGGGGVQQIKLRTEGRENGDLGVVSL
jgi:hypothetical protein